MKDYWSGMQGSVLKFNLLTFFILSCVCDRRRAFSFLLSSDLLELVGDEEVPEFSPLGSGLVRRVQVGLEAVADHGLVDQPVPPINQGSVLLSWVKVD